MFISRSAACVVATFAVCASLALPVRAGTDENQIATLLRTSAAYWNNGDLDDFMRSYENSPATTYVSTKAIVHGYAAIRAHYAAHYRSGMGTLSISDVAVRDLGADYAVVIARWHLATPAGAHPSGIFSLVMHRTNGWHIITDHSP